MKKATIGLASALAMICGLDARGEELPKATRPSPIVIENVGAKPLACGLLFAHWYRQDFKAIAPGSTLRMPLDLAPDTETVYLLNSVNHPMSVQDMFCAAEGTDWKQVTHLDYRALALKAVSRPMHLKCASDGSQLACEDFTQ